ncbi:MAG: YceI family protein [Acidobacteriota bacterium]|nr:YceI family protein [Acidobacteriota bacterium]MDQ7086660.1 YceI family protein [Acidobacteriota bacterium]
MSYRTLRTSLLAAAFFAVAGPAFAADTYKIDPVHTNVIFAIEHLGVSKFHGRFNDVSGTFTIDKADPAASSIHLEIKAASVDTHSEKRDNHIKSPDFFNVRQFPVITFKSTKVSAKGKTWTISGDLSFHGVTRNITVDFHLIGEGKDPWGNYRAGGTVRFTIKRSDFGMKYMQGPLGDEVEIIVNIEGIRG